MLPIRLRIIYDYIASIKIQDRAVDQEALWDELEELRLYLDKHGESPELQKLTRPPSESDPARMTGISPDRCPSCNRKW